MSQLRPLNFRGSAIQGILDQLAQLRLQIFFDFPYLYQGNFAYEQDYLGRYVACPQAAVFTLWQEEKLVGASTCLPLSVEPPELWQSFLEQGLNPENYFYFGESLLLPPYRGQGWGHYFFDCREQEAQSLAQYQHTCFCAVLRSEQHPLRPKDYRPHDAFWLKRGYQVQNQLLARMTWPDRNESQASEKQLVFWTKAL